jgi:hypothetical protein
VVREVITILKDHVPMYHPSEVDTHPICFHPVDDKMYGTQYQEGKWIINIHQEVEDYLVK